MPPTAAPGAKAALASGSRPLSCVLLLCQELDGWGGVSGTGWGARSSCQMRLASWRLSDRIASRWVLPSVSLRARNSIVSGWQRGAGDDDAVNGGVDLAVAAAIEAVAIGAAAA